jgi:hypothetical protein
MIALDEITALEGPIFFGFSHLLRARMQRTTPATRAASEKLNHHSALSQVPLQLVLALAGK